MTILSQSRLSLQSNSLIREEETKPKIIKKKKKILKKISEPKISDPASFF
tara:strand:- start:1074 stop:1223 length:150 start_codon:yes stop_codon:yes gene_type:complete